jgi:uncharacterized membrane protein YkvA (DUF1232 family)
VAAGRLRTWAQALKRDVVALWFAYRDPRTPLAAKLLAMAVVAYAMSPIDLIPDFIPVLGYLDELILLPAAIYLILQLVPKPVLTEAREKAEQWSQEHRVRPRNWLAGAAIVCIWGLLAWLGWRALAAD